MNCAYCYEKNKRSSNISISCVKQILKNIYANDTAPDVIEIFGGEPLLNWQAFLTILDYCNERKTPMSTSTNGLLLTHDKIDVLKRYNIAVGISYDGRTTHDIYRRTNRNADTEYRVRSAIVRSLKKGLPITINMAFQRANAKCILKDIKELYGMGINRIKIHTVNHNQFSVNDEKRVHIFKQLMRFARNNQMHISLNMALVKPKIEHYYYYDTATKIQHKGRLGHWATVGWE